MGNLIDLLKSIFGGSTTQNQSTSQSVVVNNYLSKESTSVPEAIQSSSEVPTNKLRVLFIDDEIKFPIVRILRKQPFIHTSDIVNDLSSYAERELVDADAVFVDVEGVGKILTPNEQGLGLALEIKKRFSNKKVFLYSSNPQRDMTHPAIRAVDGILKKEAQPTEFIRVLETIYAAKS